MVWDDQQISEEFPWPYMQELFKRKETLEKAVNVTLRQSRYAEVLILFIQGIV